MKLSVLYSRYIPYKVIIMRKKLSKIANISAGVYGRANRQGTIYYLQRRDFDKEERLITKGLEPSLLEDSTIQKHLLQPNDIVVTARGGDNLAFVYKGEVAPAVASPTFLVLRDINQQQVLSDYLAWFINYPKTQDYLRKMAKGTSLPAINKNTLKALTIPLLSIQKQHLMMQLYALQKREQAIYRELSELSASMINQQLNQLLKEG